MVDMPFDVIIEILLWLPARSLLRFKCVCRSWYRLLRRPAFIKLHLLRANQSNPSLSILYNYTDNTSYCVDPVTSSEPVKLENLPSINIRGCCNGLVCTSKWSSITLWNPVTRESKDLPMPPPNLLNRSSILVADRFSVIGIGWDAKKDDYKVLGVQVLHPFFEGMLQKRDDLMVYSLRANSWRKIRQSTYSLWYFKPYCSMFLEGGLNWLVPKAELILSFDMEKEVFKEILLPKSDGFNCTNIGMGELQGWLSIVMNLNLIFEERIDIWIMKGYGVEKSWSKQFSIEMSQFPGEFYGIIPVCLQRNKLVLAQSERGLIYLNTKAGSFEERGLISFNTKTGSVEDIEICGTTTLNWRYLCGHVESLVSLKAYGDNNTA